MPSSVIERLEQGVERLLVALDKEQKKARELAIKAAELEARLARPSVEIEALKAENERLRRNTTIAAEKIEELRNRL